MKDPNTPAASVQMPIGSGTAANNKVAFWYIRTGGAYGIGVAEINSMPESASFVLVGLAFLASSMIASRKMHRGRQFDSSTSVPDL